MDDWAKIRQLFSTGEHSRREIGRLVGVSRGTVEREEAAVGMVLRRGLDPSTPSLSDRLDQHCRTWHPRTAP